MEHEEKKKSRGHKFYANSPRMERDTETGKMGVTHKQKEAAQVDSGTEQMAEHESHMKDLLHKHAMERLELHHKHEKEHMELQHKMRQHHEEHKSAEHHAESGKEEEHKVEHEGDKK